MELVPIRRCWLQLDLATITRQTPRRRQKPDALVNVLICSADAVGNVWPIHREVGPADDTPLARSHGNSPSAFLIVSVVAAVPGVGAAALDCSNPAHAIKSRAFLDSLST